MLHVAYRLSLASASMHILDVTVEVTGITTPTLDLAMAAWAPGSYLIRDYARHVQNVKGSVAGAAPIKCVKIRKNCWRFSCPKSALTVRYQVFCREATVRTNFVDEHVALLHGAPTYLWPISCPSASYEVSVLPQHADDTVCTTLTPVVRKERHTFCAPDLDALIDTPLLIGRPVTASFEVSGRPHQLALVGDTRFFDVRQAARDAQKIVVAHEALWKELPYAQYLFLAFLCEGRGGLEHRDSSVLMASPYTTRSRAAYLSWLTLVSHEHFHVWNIKRLRPKALGPFDYERETPTPSLWISEGLTAYYDALQVRRANLITEIEYLEELAVPMRGLDQAYGRRLQSLTESSFDAWIKLYRPDENSRNSSISYYGKGAIVGFLLDALIRRQSEGKRSLDDLMRGAYARFAQERGFEEHEFRQLASEVAGSDLDEFFARYVDGTEEVDYAPAFEVFGLKWRVAKETSSPVASLGLATRAEGPRLYIAEVRREGPACQAGLQVDDELISLATLRLDAANLTSRLSLFSPDEKVEVEVARRGIMMSRTVCLERRPGGLGDLVVSEDATPAQNEARAVWQSLSR